MPIESFFVKMLPELQKINLELDDKKISKISRNNVHLRKKKTLVQIVACLDFTDGFENKNLLSFFSCISHVHFIAYITLKRPGLSTFIANFRSGFFGSYFIYIPTNYFNSFMSQLMTKFFADTMACSCDNSNFTLKVR